MRCDLDAPPRHLEPEKPRVQKYWAQLHIHRRNPASCHTRAVVQPWGSILIRRSVVARVAGDAAYQLESQLALHPPLRQANNTAAPAHLVRAEDIMEEIGITALPASHEVGLSPGYAERVAAGRRLIATTNGSKHARLWRALTDSITIHIHRIQAIPNSQKRHRWPRAS